MHYGAPTEDQQAKISWTNTLFLVLTPLLAVVLTPLYIYYNGVHWAEPTAFVALWVLTGLGITAGYHRMFSHRAWWAPKPIRALMLILGAMTWQNSAIAWVARHRLHHRHVDTEDDPYNIKRGFWWAHMLWVMVDDRDYDDFKNARDLVEDDLARFQHDHYMWISLGFNIAIPLALGLAIDRVWGMLLWAGLIRIVVLHHLTFFINSLAHMWGRRPWNDDETARDNAFLAVLTLGEGYHNFHHTFPADYRNGFRWYHFDPTKWFIWTLSKLGLATDLRRSPIDRRLRKRWKNMRSRYESQMDEWSESMREQFDAAEARLEEALSDMRTKRGEWVRKAEEVQAQAREDLREAREEAEHRALEAFRAWTQSLPARAS
jgi:stearoyl-CoA desaturase (delta-9 desaturase)